MACGVTCAVWLIMIDREYLLIICYLFTLQSTVPPEMVCQAIYMWYLYIGSDRWSLKKPFLMYECCYKQRSTYNIQH